MKYTISLLYIFFSILGLTFLKLGSIKNSLILFRIGNIEINCWYIIGFLFYGISFLLYTIVISKFDLSYIAPVMGGIINTVVVFIGIILFHEQTTSLSMTGCILIIAGLILMNINK